MSQQLKRMVIDSLIYTGLFYLLCLTVFIPLFGLITIWMLPVPFFIYRVRHEPGAMALPAIYFGLFFLLFPMAVFLFWFVIAWMVGGVMGTLYRRNQTSGTDVVLSGIISGALALLIDLVLGERLFGLMKLLRKYWQQQSEQTIQIMKQAGVGEVVLPPIEAFIPIFMLLFIIPLSLVTFFTARYWLTRLNVPVKTLPPFRKWRLPRLFVTFYLILLAVELFQMVSGQGAMNNAWILSIWWVLEFLFIIQGFAFISFMLHLYQKSQGWLILVFILSLPFAILLSIIGLLDAALDIRSRMEAMRKK